MVIFICRNVSYDTIGGAKKMYKKSLGTGCRSLSGGIKLLKVLKGLIPQPK